MAAVPEPFQRLRGCAMDRNETFCPEYDAMMLDLQVSCRDSSLFSLNGWDSSAAQGGTGGI